MEPSPTNLDRPGAGGVAPWKVLAVSSSGGVLLDLLALRPWLERHDATWVSVPASDTRAVLADQDVRWTKECGAVSPISLLTATRAAARILDSVKPDIVISAGTGLAVPFFAICRLRRTPCVWVETLNVIGRPGRAARICSRLASLTLVQHPELVASRRRAVLVGELY